ncbi:unnamed protein product [Prorocentrum cordatum]|uniref:Protein NLRC3 n=1 Tax=Prorocentrum cordatum TaxID=2364126 RepID=A0ABN9VY83_9DINO|nr:unnamed protein product [Polarella glacialis]
MAAPPQKRPRAAAGRRRRSDLPERPRCNPEQPGPVGSAGARLWRAAEGQDPDVLWPGARGLELLSGLAAAVPSRGPAGAFAGEHQARRAHNAQAPRTAAQPGDSPPCAAPAVAADAAVWSWSGLAAGLNQDLRERARPTSRGRLGLQMRPQSSGALEARRGSSAGEAIEFEEAREWRKSVLLPCQPSGLKRFGSPPRQPWRGPARGCREAPRHRRTRMRLVDPPAWGRPARGCREAHRRAARRFAAPHRAGAHREAAGRRPATAAPRGASAPRAKQPTAEPLLFGSAPGPEVQDASSAWQAHVLRKGAALFDAAAAAQPAPRRQDCGGQGQGPERRRGKRSNTAEALKVAREALSTQHAAMLGGEPETPPAGAAVAREDLGDRRGAVAWAPRGAAATPTGGAAVLALPGEDAATAVAWNASHMPALREVEVPEEKLEIWDRLRGDEIEPVLTSGAVCLLSAQALIQMDKAGTKLLPRQAAPPEAHASTSELQAGTPLHNTSSLPVVCVSHCWLRPDHPDPRGHNLRTLSRALGLLVKERGGEWGVFLDFACIHQNCRDAHGVPTQATFKWLETEGRLADGAVGRFDAEETLFKQALGGLGTLYTHQHTTVFMLTALPPSYDYQDKHARAGDVAPYTERGWCFCEASWACMVKSFDKVLDLALDDGAASYLHLESVCKPSWRPALLPSRFAEQLADKSFTNGPTDGLLVARLYREAFELRFRQIEVLNFCGVSAEAAAAVLEVVASSATPALRELNLDGNDLPPAVAQTLGEALLRAPALHLLLLASNSVGDVGARALATALPRAPALRQLGLSCNGVGYAGAKALALALPRAPALQRLDLGRNGVGDFGARELALALPRAMALQELDLCNNGIGELGARALAHALPRALALRVLLLDHNAAGEIGARALAQALLGAPALQQLSLRANLFGAEAESALRADGAAAGIRVCVD